MATAKHLEFISKFEGDYYFLSNFYHPCPIQYEGLLYLNSEAAYQSAKCINMKDRLEFTDLTPARAKTLGRSIKMRSDWESIKEKVMYDVCFAKFSKNPILKEKLLATGNAILIEGNTWGDTEWGKCNGIGENKLGKILMKIRSELAKT